jgi:8-amino-7-oxononanoate synthase
MSGPASEAWAEPPGPAASGPTTAPRAAPVAGAIPIPPGHPGSRDPLDWIAEERSRLRRLSLERQPRIRGGRQGRVVDLDGRLLVNFGSNDYLGLAGDIRLTRAASRGGCAEGFGAGASPLVSGQSRAHERLESAIARLLCTDAAVVFSSGFAANVAAIPALVGAADSIFCDCRNHASILDGCRLSRARIVSFPHRDMATLAELLAADRDARRRLIVTDTLFSMDGTIAPLADLCELARRHGAILMVDEAHATGVFGSRGSGLVEASGCEDGVHVRVGTLSKAVGAAGGFVAGSADLVAWLRHAARSWVFSTAHPPPVAAAAERAIRIIEEEPRRRLDLADRAAEVRRALRSAGVDLGDAEGQILPIVAGRPEAALAMQARLASAGLFTPAIRPPSVPHGRSLVRASLSFAHERDDLDRLVEAFRHR